jgi:hypothetical protein
LSPKHSNYLAEVFLALAGRGIKGLNFRVVDFACEIDSLRIHSVQAGRAVFMTVSMRMAITIQPVLLL